MNILFHLKLFLKISNNCLESINLPDSQTRYINIDFEISNCIFSRSNWYQGNGGIIYCNNINNPLKVSNCIFIQCYSAYNGGAIFYESTLINSGCFFKKICAFQCSCNSNNKYGHFAGINLANGDYQSFHELISLNQCPTNYIGWFPIILNQGNQSFFYNNISYNYCEYESILGSSLPLSFICKYSTFSDNQASKDISMYLYGHSLDGYFYFCNFVNNYVYHSRGHFYLDVNSKIFIYNTVFSNNNNILYYINSGSITLNNCLINHLYSTGSIVITSNNNSFTSLSNYFPINILQYRPAG